MDTDQISALQAKKERKILLLSFTGGLLFAIVEFIFAIYSHSQSSLTDAIYDAVELVFIALMIFITPLFYKPVSEKHPYGYCQIETVFLIIKNVMLMSVTVSILAGVIDSAIHGGNNVDSIQVAVFQLILGIASIFVYLVMRQMNHSLTSQMIDAELLGWKLDIYYSIGMSLAFFGSLILKHTPLAFIAPYFDQIMAIMVMLFMMPETIHMLIITVREALLFSPDSEISRNVKKICTKKLKSYGFDPVFFDVIKTGRHLWVTIYYECDEEYISTALFHQVSGELNVDLQNEYGDATCELVLTKDD